MATLVQSAGTAVSSTGGSISLSGVPTEGNLLVAFVAARLNGGGSAAQTGWESYPTAAGITMSDHVQLWAYSRIVEASDTGSYSWTFPASNKYIHMQEWSGVGGTADWASLGSSVPAGTVTLGTATHGGTAGLAVGAIVARGPGQAGGNTLPDLDILAPFTQAWYSDVDGTTDPDSTNGNSPAYAIGYQALGTAGDVTMAATYETGGFAEGPWGGILLVFEGAAEVPASPEPGYWFDWARDGFDDGSGGGDDDPRLARSLPQAAAIGTAAGGDNVTRWVMSSTWQRGGSYDHVGGAGPGGFTIYLDNSDGRFDPDNTASPYYGYMRPGLPVWAGAVKDTGAMSGAGSVAGFIAGYVREFVPTVDSTGKRVCEVIGEDAFGVYQRTPASVVPSLSRSQATFRGLILDAVGESASRRDLGAESGSLPFSAVDEENGLNVLEELNRATGSRHFIRPADSKEEWFDYVSVNRVHGLQDAALQALDGEDITDIAGWRVTNDNVIEVQRATVEPIGVTAESAEVWRFADAPFTVTNTASRVIFADFDDYVFDAVVDTNVSSGAITSTITNFGKSAKIELWATTSPAAVGLLRILGRQVTRGDSQTVVAGDESPGARAGSVISSDYIGQSGAAQALVDFLVWKFGQPLKRPNFTVVGKNAATFEFIFERDLYDVVTLTVDRLTTSARRLELIGLRGTHQPGRDGNGLWSVTYEAQETPNQTAVEWFTIDADLVNGPALIAPF